MDFLKEINKVALIAEHKPAIKLGELIIGTPYQIQGAKVVTSKFGETVLLELEEAVTFLPTRVTATFQPKIEEIGSGKYALIFRGLVKTGKFHPAASFEIVAITN